MIGIKKLELRALLVATTLGLGLGLAACDKNDDRPMENAAENVKDGLNVRDNEQMKDAGENVGEAAENVGDAVEEKTEDMKN